jgi:hypothetical protein
VRDPQDPLAIPLRILVHPLDAALQPYPVFETDESMMVRDLGGRIEIVGGTEEDRREAREWASRFLRRLDPSRSIR